MNHFILMAGYDIDYGLLRVMFSDGSCADYDIDRFEETLDTVLITGAQLDWLLYNEPVSYAELMLTGRMQDYLDLCADEYRSARDGIREQLGEVLDEATAEYLSREFMRYES